MKNKEKINSKYCYKTSSNPESISHWFVMQGGPISACTQTRQQARKVMKKLREIPIQNGAFLFIGKYIDIDGKHGKLILDV